MSTTTAHLAALGRAELILLGRHRTNLFTVLFVPAMLTVAMKPTFAMYDLPEAGLTLGPLMISAAVGIVLVMALYTTLTGVYATRREELLLKRLRTGEATDAEILAGSAIPMALVALVQCLILAVGIAAVAGMGAPAAPHLAILGILLGIVLMSVMAAATSALAKTAESAQVVVWPGMLVFLLGSGMLIPLEILPDGLRAVCQRLPLTPVIDLVRSGWTGEASWGETALHVLTALVWTGLALLAVRRWFRWEPRT